MSSSVDRLGGWVANILVDHVTHETLPQACAEIGLERHLVEDDGSKRERILKRFAGKNAHDIAVVAEQAGIRYANIQLQEAALMVLEGDGRALTEITRRDIARCFEPTTLSGELALLDLLRRVWPIDSMDAGIPFGPSLADEIHRHMIRNDDWTVEDLFERLGALTCSRKRFFQLLEAVMHPVARRGVAQEHLRERINDILSRDGYGLDVAGTESGYPIYRVVTLGSGVAGKPKNLIFASIGPKPEIGFLDAINNDIVILSNEESCLVYDHPIGVNGLRWSDMVRWWQNEHCPPGTAEVEARVSLGKRLQSSLASEAERNFFKIYFHKFRPTLGRALPALIPQVYLHYDPAVVARLRHRKSFPRPRMDFLLLLPQNARIVIEIDGQHHFSRDKQPSLEVYAETMKADRDLRLLGYEVYRFGANELVGENAPDLLYSYFQRLFERHRVR